MKKALRLVKLSLGVKELLRSHSQPIHLINLTIIIVIIFITYRSRKEFLEGFDGTMQIGVLSVERLLRAPSFGSLKTREVFPG